MSPFADDLWVRIQSELAEMADRVQIAMQDATESLLNIDVTLAEEVISSDAGIDALHRNVEAKATELLTRAQLTEADSALGIAAIRISTSLERMGDLASHIAKQTRLKYPFPCVPDELQPKFETMSHIAIRIADKAGIAILAPNTADYTEIKSIDESMNEIHRSLFDEMLDTNWSHGVETAIDVTLLSRYFERYADHATSVAKRLSILVEQQVFELPNSADAGGLPA